MLYFVMSLSTNVYFQTPQDAGHRVFVQGGGRLPVPAGEGLHLRAQAARAHPF